MTAKPPYDAEKVAPAPADISSPAWDPEGVLTSAGQRMQELRRWAMEQAIVFVSSPHIMVAEGDTVWTVAAGILAYVTEGKTP